MTTTETQQQTIGRVLQQLELLTTGGANITYIREAIAVIKVLQRSEGILTDTYVEFVERTRAQATAATELIVTERALADDLAAKIAVATAAWDAEDVQERNDLSDDFWQAVGGLFGALTSYRKARDHGAG